MEGPAVYSPIVAIDTSQNSQTKPAICDQKGLPLCNISKHILDLRQVSCVLGFSNLQEYYSPVYESSLLLLLLSHFSSVRLCVTP